ncbi:MAG: 23S rRNA (uracil(1939)-C(5))-methyltransferase RlmD [Clostridia bacterium]|nr:23S rRNA (uracil(1939)-C(5))-methyltransferase RlmD [Clostridia bacterium]
MLQPNQTIELNIHDLGMEGEGIGRYEDITFFVPYALPGERVKAKITHIKRNKNIGFADLKEVIEASPYRVKTPCNRFGRCGGCTLMHLEYDEQLKYKRKSVENVLRKNARYQGEVQEVVRSNPFAYRNKAQLPFGMVNGKVAVGFYGTGTHKIVSSTKCFLHGEWLERLIKIVLDFANEKGLTAYNELTKKGLLRHLVARYVGGQMVVTIVINGVKLDGANELADRLENEFSGASLYLSPNTRDTNVIMGNSLIPIRPTPQSVEVMGITIGVNPFSFFQVNDEIREKLYNRVIEKVAPSEDVVVIDAYAGVGLLGAIMAKRGATIFNIEIIKEATTDSIKLYSANGISDKVVNVCGDAAIELKNLVSSPKDKASSAHSAKFKQLVEDGKKVTIILDPPRKGISMEVANTLNELAKTLDFDLIYISCNPATLSRDMANLTMFTPIEVMPFDMFPHTGHVESVVCFTRRLDVDMRR